MRYRASDSNGSLILWKERENLHGEQEEKKNRCKTPVLGLLMISNKRPLKTSAFLIFILNAYSEEVLCLVDMILEKFDEISQGNY